MRAFFCLDLEPQLKSQIYKDFSHLRRSAARVGWVKPDNFHITLKFLGEIEQSSVEALQALGHRILEQAKLTKPVEIALAKIGGFPNLKRPRVIWLGPEKQPAELISMAKNLDSELESIGFEKEKNQFSTHLTLGRVREQNRHLDELIQLIERTPEFSYELKISELTLMKSELAPGGSKYSPIFKIPFVNA